MRQLQVQNKLVSKIVKMADGRMALVSFIVYLENGAPKAKIISVKYSGKSFDQKKPPVAICGNIKESLPLTLVRSLYRSVVSPYIQFAFFVSQPTRAPNFI